MKTVWKFQLELTDRQFVSTPVGATPLSMQMQNGFLCLWAEVESDNPQQANELEIAICGTGHSLPAYQRFLGTVQMQQGALVWHVFQL